MTDKILDIKEFNDFVTYQYKFIQPKKNNKYICNVEWNDRQYVTNSNKIDLESNVDYISTVSQIWVAKLTHLLLCTSFFCITILLLSSMYSSKFVVGTIGIITIFCFMLVIISRYYSSNYVNKLKNILSNDCIYNKELTDPFQSYEFGK
jgi:hypothetical protein